MMMMMMMMMTYLHHHTILTQSATISIPSQSMLTGTNANSGLLSPDNDDNCVFMTTSV